MNRLLTILNEAVHETQALAQAYKTLLAELERRELELKTSLKLHDEKLVTLEAREAVIAPVENLHKAQAELDARAIKLSQERTDLEANKQKFKTESDAMYFRLTWLPY